MSLDRYWARMLAAAATIGMRQQLLMLRLYTSAEAASTAWEAWPGELRRHPLDLLGLDVETVPLQLIAEKVAAEASPHSTCRCLAAARRTGTSSPRVRPRVLMAWQFGQRAIIWTG
jgi:hypothetical protein